MLTDNIALYCPLWGRIVFALQTPPYMKHCRQDKRFSIHFAVHSASQVTRG